MTKSIRDQRHWTPGTRLLVENTADSVLLRNAPVFTPTRPEDVFDSLSYQGPPMTLEDMDAAITAEVRRRHDRGRYERHRSVSGQRRA